MYLNGAGQPIIVINTLAVAADLLDRKAAVTSDRPRLVLTEMMTHGIFMPFIRYNLMLVYLYTGDSTRPG